MIIRYAILCLILVSTLLTGCVGLRKSDQNSANNGSVNAPSYENRVSGLDLSSNQKGTVGSVNVAPVMESDPIKLDTPPASKTQNTNTTTAGNNNYILTYDPIVVRLLVILLCVQMPLTYPVGKLIWRFFENRKHKKVK